MYGNVTMRLPCIDIINKQNGLFKKKKTKRKVKQDLSGSWYQWEEGGHMKG
jgi:hypothetical protein